ncbi:Uncharacterised protein [Klebsiella pneumoniae]|nr:Uncharacterised protein [Klebsiella pneumoniae]
MAKLKDLSQQLKQLQKQIPFATAQAMTTVVREIAAAQKVALGRKLESPAPFTVSAVGASGARKNNLRAKVYVRDIAAEYLEPFEFGGEHKLNSQALRNPKNIKLNYLTDHDIDVLDKQTKRDILAHNKAVQANCSQLTERVQVIQL